jgi:arginase
VHGNATECGINTTRITAPRENKTFIRKVSKNHYFLRSRILRPNESAHHGMFPHPPPLSLIGAPSSAGAYAPGQEKAPAALRHAGLVDLFADHRIHLVDRGDVPGFRWRPDPAHLRAMNPSAVAAVASAVAREVAEALRDGGGALVLGGDCTVEIGSVVGALADHSATIGLIYVDLDTDLNTPESTTDGALDWMGVAHLLGLPDTIPELVALGPRKPLLRPEQIMFFAHDNVEPFERRVIADLGIAETPLAKVNADPLGAGRKVTEWARQFDRVLVHLDVDVLSFVDTPLAENVRRNVGLRLNTLMSALGPIFQAPNLATLTVTEINPDHGAVDGSTLREFATAVAAVFSDSRFASPLSRTGR